MNWIDWIPQLADGLWISLQVTLLSLAIGVPLGLIFALLSSRRNRVVKLIAVAFVEVGRGMPALVMLQMVYFGLPSTGIVLEAYWAAILALTLTTGAYTAEIIRAGLRAVPDGEVEAANALGLTPADVTRFVVIPQGIRIAIPALLGFSILILQVSSLAYTIGLPELLSQAYSIGASTFRYLPVLALAGGMYLLITIPGGWLVEWFERRLSRHLR